MRIAIYQMADRGEAELNIKAAYRAVVETKADFFCLPEFFSIPADYKKRGKSLEDAWFETSVPAIESLKKASMRFKGYIIGGSVLEKCEDRYYNTCFVFRDGEIVAKYRKINLTDWEASIGISPGNETVSVKTKFGRFGVLICADCLNEKIVDRVARENDLIFLPISITNPAHAKVEGHPVSEKIARKYGVVVVKTSRIAYGVGVKSAVVKPDGIALEARNCCEEELILAYI